MGVNVEPVAASEDSRVDLVALWRLLWENKVLIVASTAACGVIAVVLALTATPMFKAEASITQVTNTNLGAAAGLASQLGGLASLVGVNLGAAGGLDRDALAVLKSRNLVEEFVRSHDLVPVLYKDAKKPPTLWLATRRFKNDVLSIREDKRNGVTVIAINWKDPKVAAQWANDFVRLANDMVRRRAMDDAKASIAYLADQVQQTKVVEMQRVMYNLIENETKTLMLANVKSEYAFALVDPAVPPEVRNTPKRTIMVLIGLVVGGVIGVMLALGRNLLREYRRTTRLAAAEQA
jgi:uncharacterized protein involved in exopolysaccharide biosynthesis